VEEPTEAVACTCARNRRSLEKHHNLRILDEAVTATVRLSHRYIAGRQLPDKAVSVLDTACARLALGRIRHRRALKICSGRSTRLKCSSEFFIARRRLARTTRRNWRTSKRRLPPRTKRGGSERAVEKEKGLIEKIRGLHEKLRRKSLRMPRSTRTRAS